MPKVAQLEVWVVYDEAGDYAVGTDAESAGEAYRDAIGAEMGSLGSRIVNLTLSVPLPETIEATVEVPAPDEPVRVAVG